MLFFARSCKSSGLIGVCRSLSSLGPQRSLNLVRCASSTIEPRWMDKYEATTVAESAAGLLLNSLLTSRLSSLLTPKRRLEPAAT